MTPSDDTPASTTPYPGLADDIRRTLQAMRDSKKLRSRRRPWLRRIRKPHWYQLTPTYFQLSYQLVAVQANRLADSESQLESDPTPAIRQSLDDARVLSDEVDLVLFWLNDRVSRFRRLPGPEERLRWFLLDTVAPCTAIIIAALSPDRRQGPGHAPSAVLPIHTGEVRQYRSFGRLRRRVVRLSPRTLFNLACFEAMLGRETVSLRSWSSANLAEATGQEAEPSDRRVRIAIWALDTALRRSYGYDRQSLLARVRTDPSIRDLDALLPEETQELFDRYYIPPIEPPPEAEPPTTRDSASV